MKQLRTEFDVNTKGRDFVIGDLHGSYSLFEQLLEGLSFDPAVDRMFSVGDLCDRGPESLRCLELLHEPWFHAVLSNHEYMMLEAFRGGWIGTYWPPNGGEWGVQYLSDYRAGVEPTGDAISMMASLKKVEELPLLITVNRKDASKIHVLHAELPLDASVTDATLADDAQLYRLATTTTPNGDYILWGRALFGPFIFQQLNRNDKLLRTIDYAKMDARFSDELSHIVSGHSILQQPMTIIGQTNIDTGAYLSYGGDRAWAALTCIELDTWTFYQVNHQGFKQTDPVVVSRADLDDLRSK